MHTYITGGGGDNLSSLKFLSSLYDSAFLCEENNNSPFLIYTLLSFCLFFMSKVRIRGSWNIAYTFFPQTHKIILYIFLLNMKFSVSFRFWLWHSRWNEFHCFQSFFQFRNRQPIISFFWSMPLQELHSWFFGHISLARELSIIQ